MYHDVTIARLAAIQPLDIQDKGMIGRMINAAARSVSAEWRKQRRLENRRAVTREIAGLPAKLRYDLAFSDLPFESDRSR